MIRLALLLLPALAGAAPQAALPAVPPAAPRCRSGYPAIFTANPFRPWDCPEQEAPLPLTQRTADDSPSRLPKPSRRNRSRMDLKPFAGSWSGMVHYHGRTYETHLTLKPKFRGYDLDWTSMDQEFQDTYELKADIMAFPLQSGHYHAETTMPAVPAFGTLDGELWIGAPTAFALLAAGYDYQLLLTFADRPERQSLLLALPKDGRLRYHFFYEAPTGAVLEAAGELTAQPSK